MALVCGLIIGSIFRHVVTLTREMIVKRAFTLLHLYEDKRCSKICD